MNGEQRRLNFLLEGLAELPSSLLGFSAGQQGRTHDWLDEWAVARQLRELTRLLAERMQRLRAALGRKDRKGALDICLEEPSLPLLGRGLHGLDAAALRAWDRRCEQRVLPRLDAKALDLLAEEPPSEKAWPREPGIAFSRLAGWPELVRELRPGATEVKEQQRKLADATEKHRKASGAHAESARMALLERLRLLETLLLWGDSPREHAKACHEIRGELLAPLLAAQLRTLAAGLPDTADQILEALNRARALGVAPHAVIQPLPDWAATQVHQRLKTDLEAERKQAVFTATDTRELLAGAEARGAKVRFGEFATGVDALVRAVRLDPEAHRASFEEKETRLAFEEWAQDFARLAELRKQETAGDLALAQVKEHHLRSTAGQTLKDRRADLARLHEGFQKARRETRANFVDEAGQSRNECAGRGWTEALGLVTGELRRRSRVLWAQVSTAVMLVLLSVAATKGYSASLAEASDQAKTLQALREQREVEPVATALEKGRTSRALLGAFRLIPAWKDAEAATQSWLEKERRLAADFAALVGELPKWKAEVPQSLALPGTWTDAEPAASAWDKQFTDGARLAKEVAPDLGKEAAGRFREHLAAWETFRKEQRANATAQAEAVVADFAKVLQAGRQAKQNPDLAGLLEQVKTAQASLDVPGSLPLEPITGNNRVLEELRPEPEARHRLAQTREAASAVVSGLEQWIAWETALAEVKNPADYLASLGRQPARNAVIEPFLPLGAEMAGGRITEAFQGRGFVDLVFGSGLLAQARKVAGMAASPASGGTGGASPTVDARRTLERAAIPFPAQLNDHEKARLAALRSDWMLHDIYSYTSTSSGRVLHFGRGLPATKELPPVAVPEGSPPPPTLTEKSGEFYTPAKSPGTLDFRLLTSRISVSGTGQETVTGDSLPRITQPKLSAESEFVRQAMAAHFDLLAERPQLSLLAFVDSLAAAKDVSPLFKAALHLRLAEFMGGRPESWGVTWTLFDADLLRLKKLFTAESADPPGLGDWMVPESSQRWNKALAAYYEGIAGNPYVSQHLATANALARVEENPFPWLGHIDAAGRLFAEDQAVSSHREVWGLHHDVVKEKIVPVALYRRDTAGTFQPVNPPLPLTPVYGVSEALLALRAETATNPVLRALLGD